AKPFSNPPQAFAHSSPVLEPAPLPSSIETWLIEPLRAPDFSLPDLAGKLRTLDSFQDAYLLLCFWTSTSPESTRQLQHFQQTLSTLDSNSLRVAAINVDEPTDLPTA